MTSIKLATQAMFIALTLLALTACTAPAPSSAPAQTPASAPEASVPVAASQTEAVPPTTGNPAPVRTKPAPPMSDPLPPEVMSTPTTAGKPVVIDQSCKTSADCVVKDVGSCCGAMPACVNRNSRTHPAAVQAECARKGMASVCGFNEITACICANGQCISEQEPVGGWINGAPPPQTDH